MKAKIKDDRFQHQPWYIKLWRLRCYIPIPFWVIRSKIKNPNDSWKFIWGLEIGMAQISDRMKWIYTMDEVFDQEGNIRK